MTEELKPCPFCGEKKISLNPKTKEYSGSINCPACLVSLPMEFDCAELIHCWNTRADTSDPVMAGLQERIEAHEIGLKIWAATVEQMTLRIKELEERIENLKSALKFYADKDNNGTCAGCIRALGYGNTAREALKEDK